MITDDPTDPNLHRRQPNGQNEAYLVLPESERAKGYVRPYRDTYTHVKCDRTTKMSREISETYARDPSFYGATFCCHCRAHFPLVEFKWTGTDITVGT